MDITQLEKKYGTLNSMRAKMDKKKIQKKTNPIPFDKIEYNIDELTKRLRSGDKSLSEEYFTHHVYPAILGVDKPTFRKENLQAIRAMFEHFGRFIEQKPTRNKGFYVWGLNGSGKSKIMAAMKQLNYPIGKPYVAGISYHKLCKDFMQHGESVITELRQEELIIDDLGFNQEGKKKRFGNEVDLVSDIVYQRHRLFESRGYVTHFTSNFSGDSLKNNGYSQGTVDRIFEMCYNIKWMGKSFRIKENI